MPVFSLPMWLGTRTHPIVNTAMIGAFSRMLGMPPLDAIAAAIREDLAAEAQSNIEAVRDAHREVCLLGMIG
jgi:Pyruvate/2-oxoacid:ferredoxin oxidoreductase gamma subunit